MMAMETRFRSFGMVHLRSASVKKLESGMPVDMSKYDGKER
jgi:hypothetical protein